MWVIERLNGRLRRNRIDSLRSVVRDLRVGLMFLIPNIENAMPDRHMVILQGGHGAGVSPAATVISSDRASYAKPFRVAQVLTRK